MSIKIFKQGFLLLFIFSFLLTGCGGRKYSQCKKIITIANRVSRQTEEMTMVKSNRSPSMASWEKAAETMNSGAKEIENLSISDDRLVGYQARLVDLFNNYSQATDKAIKARKNKDFSELETARSEAIEAGKLRQDLVKGINSYCLGDI